MKYEGYQKFAYSCFLKLVPLLVFLVLLYLWMALLTVSIFVHENEALNPIRLFFLVFFPSCIIFFYLKNLLKEDGLLQRFIRKMCDSDMSFVYIVLLFVIDFLLLDIGFGYVVYWLSR